MDASAATVRLDTKSRTKPGRLVIFQLPLSQSGFGDPRSDSHLASLQTR